MLPYLKAIFFSESLILDCYGIVCIHILIKLCDILVCILLFVEYDLRASLLGANKSNDLFILVNKSTSDLLIYLSINTVIY